MNPKLYEAGINAMASDVSSKNTFESIMSAAMVATDTTCFLKDLEETEKTIREEFSLTKMPGPWRSAKSVVSNAVIMHISLVDGAGAYKGKTHLQREIREQRIATNLTPPTNVAQKVNEHCIRIHALWSGLTPEQRKNIKDYFAAMDN